jgi:DNA polymerase-3 subunit alpha
LGEADVVRKAMGKKIPEVMRQEREKFIKGAIGQGYDQALAEQVFDLVEPFAGYAFNKSHSVSYALIAYWTAYFKANYPVEYMVSVLNSRLGNQEKTASTINECFRLKIPVLLPDINRSGVEFTIDHTEESEEAIRFGLAAIKNVGEGAVQPLVEERDDEEPFKSVEDFCRRGAVHGLNRRILESLIKAGAIDSLGNRGALLASTDRILSLAQQEARLRDSGQTSMLDLFGEEVPVPMEEISLEGGDVLPREKVAWEKELLGVPLSENPMSVLAFNNNTEAIASRDQIDGGMDGQRVSVVGQLSSTAERLTRKGGTFLVATLELLGGSMEVIAWPDTYGETRDLWEEGSFLWIVGKVRQREGETSIHCEEVKPFQLDGMESEKPTAAPPAPIPAPPVYPQQMLLISLMETGNADEDVFLVHEVLRTCLEYPGNDRVNMEIHTDHQVVRMDVPIVATKYCSDLHRRLESLAGVNNLSLLEGSGNGSMP